MVLLPGLGGTSFWQGFQRGGGGEYFAKMPGGGKSIFYTHKKEAEHGIMPLSLNSYRRPECPFRTIRPCCPEKLPTPWRGTHFWHRLRRGWVPKFYRDSIFTHTKKETEQSKISLSRNSPTALDAPFKRFAPATLIIIYISFRHPGGGDTFLTASSRGGTNILRWLRAQAEISYDQSNH